MKFFRTLVKTSGFRLLLQSSTNQKPSTSCRLILLIAMVWILPCLCPADGFQMGSFVDFFGDTIYVDDDNTGGPWEGTQTNPYQHIQDAVDSAFDGDQVIVLPGAYLENVLINSKDIELISTDPNDPDVVAATIMDGRQLGSVVTITDSNSVVSGFTITNGRAAKGGGVYCSNSSPAISHCTVSSNIATVPGEADPIQNLLYTKSQDDPVDHNFYGGAIYNDHSNLTINSCTFTANGASSDQAACGGAIHNNHSSSTITNCDFNQNFTECYGCGYSLGGAIYNIDSSIVVSDCSFSDNSEGGWWDCFGEADPISNLYDAESNNNITLSECIGEPFQNGGSVYSLNSSLNIINSTFSQNGANGGSIARGGAILNACSEAVLTNCTFDDNQASSYMGKGGAVFNFSGSLTIENCMFIENLALSENFDDYGDGGDGGAVYNDNGSFTLTNCTFEGNSAFGYYQFREAISSGGAIYIVGDSAVITDCSFTSNSTDCLWGYGGAIYNAGYEVSLTGCIFEANNAVGEGSEYGSGLASGGAIYNDNSDPIMTGCSFNNNKTIGYYYGFGGAMYNSNSNPTITDSTFTENRAYSDPVIDVSFGGAMYNSDSNPMITNCKFTCNSVNGYSHSSGGAMYNENSNPMIIDCNFTENEATQQICFDEHPASGGAIYNYNGNPIVTKCTFIGNSTQGGHYYGDDLGFGSGGAMYNEVNSLTVTFCTFSENKANGNGYTAGYGYGGAMYNDKGNIKISYCTFTGNSANGVGYEESGTGSGGAVYNDGNNSILVHCTFTGNNVTGHGSGKDEYLTGYGFGYGGGLCGGSLINCILIGNTAFGGGGGCTDYNCIPGFGAGYGGGMYNSISINCTFLGNIASGDGYDESGNNVNGEGYGGGIHGPGTVKNCILWGNIAETSGNEIYEGSASFSDIQGGYAGIGNIDAEPLFVDANNNNFYLLAGSPCIDTGDSTAITEATDLNGRPRIFDGDGNGTATVDMGAYEYQPFIIYVDDSATDSTNNGTSWENAFIYLQDALAAAVYGDQIRVAQGTYKPDQSTAYPNGTGDRSASFHLVNGVALIGGYAGLSGIDPYERDCDLYETVLSGDLDDENSYHVVACRNAGTETILDGFTITGGDADASSGGGLQSIDSSIRIADCIFYANSAEDSGGGIDNHGEVLFEEQINLKVTGCTFIDNYSAWGSAMSNIGAHSELVNCKFTHNSSSYGTTLTLDHARADLTQCLFWNNSAETAIQGNNVCALKNCTLTGNSGGVELYLGSLSIENSIIWGNTDFQIYEDSEFPPEITVAYSDIQNGWTGTGNINTDPLFIDPNNGDFHLKSQYGRWDPDSQTWVYDSATSPCIDAGNPADPNWTNELWPHGKRINMGAYGGTPQASKSPSTAGNIADFTFDDCVAIDDFAEFLDQWLTCQALLPEDMELDGCVNLADFSIFAQNWFLLCPAQDLVGYWELNETSGTQAHDSSIYGNHGTLVNGPVWTGDGKLQFDGVDDYVQVSDSPSLEFTNQITISAWVMLTEDNLRFMKIVIQPANDTSADPWENYCLDLRRKNPRFGLSSGLAGSWTGAYDTTWNSPITVGAWYHLAGTYDGSTMILYVNGQPTQTKAATLSIGNNDLPLYMGSAQGTNGLGGLLDEVRIYNRALTPTEIQNLYQNP